MRSFLAETYLSRSQSDELSAIADRLRVAARDVAASGAAIRFVGSTFVPEDEICFYLFEASSAEPVGRAVSQARLGEARVVEVVGADG